MLEVNGALVKKRKSKSPNTCYGYFRQRILYRNAQGLIVVEI